MGCDQASPRLPPSKAILTENRELAGKGDSKLPIPLRRVRAVREDGKAVELLTNDLARSAVQIGALYKARWRIELLFRWLKQHLKIKKFLGTGENAVRLQLLAAMIAYVLLRLAIGANKIAIPALRFAELAAQHLLQRRRIAAIDRPPPVNPSKKRDRSSPNQIAFDYV